MLLRKGGGAGGRGNLTEMERPFEQVYTVMDYWDAPRSGFADFAGAPHAYRSIFRDDLDDYDPQYRLWPVSGEVLALAMEQWAIWNRWLDAYDAGEVDVTTHPALPADAARNAEIAPIIVGVLESPPASASRATAEFRAVCDRSQPIIRSRELEVRWTRMVTEPAQSRVSQA